MLTRSDKNQIVQIVRSHLPAVLGLYLFGSAASGEMNAESDVDLAVLIDKDLEAEAAFQLKGDLSIYLKRDVDLVDLRRADDVTTAQVVSTAEILFASDPTLCAYFETVSLSKYVQLNEERRGILEDIKARGSIYGR